MDGRLPCAGRSTLPHPPLPRLIIALMSSANQPWRLVISQASDGATNMGLDEAILQGVMSGQSPPTLRLYRWQPPALSLGYSQPAADVDLDALRARGWDLVRRPTGGRAILHTDELTYALIAPAENEHVAGGVLASYQHLSAGLEHALQQLGLSVDVRSAAPVAASERSNPVCFEVPSAYELMVDGKKIIGSAQLRRRGGVLQHGTLPLTGDIRRICQVLHFEDGAARKAAGERVAARAATASALAGRPITWDEAALAFQAGFQEAIGIQLRRAVPSDGELAHAGQLAEERYRSDDWLFRV